MVSPSTTRTVSIGDDPIRTIFGGDRPFGLIAGPCVIEGRDHTWRHATALQRICGELEVRATTAVTIVGDAPYQIDGDFGGRTPVEVRLLPTPARLFAP